MTPLVAPKRETPSQVDEVWEKSDVVKLKKEGRMNLRSQQLYRRGLNKK